MIKVKAIVKAGHQVASGRSTSDTRFPEGTIRLQEPHFKKLGCDFTELLGSDFVRATLNLSIAPYSFSILKPEYFLKSILWTDLQPAENFFISRAELYFSGQSYKSLIYIPDPSTKPNHFQDPDIIEVIAEPISNLKYGDTIELAYNPDAIQIN